MSPSIDFTLRPKAGAKRLGSHVYRYSEDAHVHFLASPLFIELYRPAVSLSNPIWATNRTDLLRGLRLEDTPRAAF